MASLAHQNGPKTPDEATMLSTTFYSVELITYQSDKNPASIATIRPFTMMV